MRFLYYGTNKAVRCSLFQQIYFMFFTGSKHFCLENDVTTLEANQFRYYYWVSKRALKRMSERKEAEI